MARSTGLLRIVAHHRSFLTAVERLHRRIDVENPALAQKRLQAISAYNSLFGLHREYSRKLLESRWFPGYFRRKRLNWGNSLLLSLVPGNKASSLRVLVLSRCAPFRTRCHRSRRPQTHIRSFSFTLAVRLDATVERRSDKLALIIVDPVLILTLSVSSRTSGAFAVLPTTLMSSPAISMLLSSKTKTFVDPIPFGLKMNSRSDWGVTSTILSSATENLV